MYGSGGSTGAARMTKRLIWDVSKPASVSAARVSLWGAAAEQARPKRNIGGLLHSSRERVLGDHVFQHAKLAARSQHPPSVGESSQLVGD
jgi:hypothetical protein